MCIIVSKEKYKEIPSKKILKNCFESNSDGAGFMYTYNNRVIIEKGFMKFDEFYNRLMEVDKTLHFKNKSLIMHFRIGTSGGYAAGACHPFPVTNNVNDLKKTETKCKLGMVHNGVISKYTYGTLSDTQNFIKDLVYPLFRINSNFLNNKHATDLLYNQCAATKLCFLDKNDNITYIGDFINDNGIKYSNSSYKDYVYTPAYKTYKYSDWLTDCEYEYEYDEDTDSYVKKEQKKGYYWLPKDEIKLLKKGMAYYDEEFLDLTEIEEDDTYYIDEYYNLYMKYNNINYSKSKWMKLQLVQANVYLYKSLHDFEELEYSEI